MRIYLSHPRGDYDFREFFYEPIQASAIAKQHEFIYPHERDYGSSPRNMKEEIKKASIVIAEVSRPSTGSGIELGWAEAYDTPTLCLYQRGRDYSRSLLVVTRHIEQYSGKDDMVEKIEKFLANNPRP